MVAHIDSRTVTIYVLPLVSSLELRDAPVMRSRTVADICCIDATL